MDDATKRLLEEQEKEKVALYTPLNDAELVKIREQQRAYLHDKWRNALENWADQVHDQRIEALKAAKKYGQSFVRTIFLLNGGAVLASLTFIGSFIARSEASLVSVGINLSRSMLPAFHLFGG